MPIIQIETTNKYSKEQEITLMQAVRSALQEAFKIANNDILVRLIVHEPHRFNVPETTPKLYAHPELYTHISIDCFSGRSLDAKRKLYQCIVKNLELLGIPNNHVKILLRESSKENWGIRGGQAGCDVEVGYAVEV